MTPDGPRPGRWFAEEWTALLGGVLESLAGERPKLSTKLSCTAPAAGATLGACRRLSASFE